MALIAALVFCVYFNLVFKEVIVKSVIVLILSVALIIVSSAAHFLEYSVVLITIIINCFNPVLLFILSNIAKNKVFRI